MSITAKHLSITLEDGRELTATSSIQLAGKWAEAMHGANWAHLTPANQSLEIAAALDGLNRAHRGNEA